MKSRLSIPQRGGPFRLLKYFIISGFAVIAVVTFLLGAFFYTRSLDTLVRWAENYARLLAENLNYNVYNGFYAPLKARGIPMDLRKWDQFGALDSLIKDFTYGLNIERIRIIDKERKIVYSTEYDLIGHLEPVDSPFDKAFGGKDVTVIRHDARFPGRWRPKWLVRTYYPLREITGNYWMQGQIYGVMEITQDVTEQYFAVQKSVVVIILVAAGLMAFLFAALTLIVRRGESILFQRAGEQERLQQQLQQSEKLASIGQMVATIAHEIRNPLGIVRSSAEVLAKKAGQDPSRAQKLSRVIVEETTRLSAILTDFLDFARPRMPQPGPVDISELVSKVRNNLEQDATDRGIRWNQENLNGDRPVVVADSDLLYQAFLNIAINAFEAMEEGGALTVQISEGDSRVRVSFSDTGHGISDEHLPNIFTPFFTTHEMGTGLGLSVVHNIVSAHKGEVQVDTSENGGAVFTVFLHRDYRELDI